MSTAILTLSENGELQKIHDRWLLKKSCSSGSESSQVDSEQLHIESFLGLFLICGIACFLALFIYVCLMVRQFKHYTPEDPGPSTPCNFRSARRLQTFLSFADEKEEIMKSKSKRKREEMSIPSNGLGKETESRNGSDRIRRDISPERNNGDSWRD